MTPCATCFSPARLSLTQNQNKKKITYGGARKLLTLAFNQKTWFVYETGGGRQCLFSKIEAIGT